MILNLSGQPLDSLWDAAISESMDGVGLTFSDVRELHVQMCGLNSLEGLEQFVNLQVLDASNNNIDAFKPLWEMNSLRTVKLRKNRFTSLCARKAGEATVLATADEVDYPVTVVKSAEYSLLDLEANEITCVLAEPDTSVTVGCLLMANNRISEVSGLSAFSGVTMFDLTGNISVDAEDILRIPFGSGPRIFLQECDITNAHRLMDLVEQDEEAELVVPGHITLDHVRVVKVGPIDLGKLLQKEFVEYESEFADFRFAGDQLPRELKTPRDYSDIRLDTAHFVVRTQCPRKNIETITTMVDLGDADKHDFRGRSNTDGSSILGTESGTNSPMSINALDTPTNRDDDTHSPKSFIRSKAFNVDGKEHIPMVEGNRKVIEAVWAEKVDRDLASHFAAMPDTIVRPTDSAA
ncbi:internalin A S-layer, putative [Babesia ovata]|uniref:Internalin A S-layer, putative n=1 Tax=Babesia ovata TaxID=189622 RepID=A0A2H6K896_9APIC|nr:internalin A S-layer, putative [Babesia ovata]GBE59214.1 internalin A S-layer, putative [Babesia ovata]